MHGLDELESTVSGGCRQFSHVEAGAELVIFSSRFIMPTVTSIGMATQTTYNCLIVERLLGETFMRFWKT